MFYSRQVYTSLEESISNYVFKEEKKIDLDSNKTEAITERCSTKSNSLWRQMIHWTCQDKQYITLKVSSSGFIRF